MAHPKIQLLERAEESLGEILVQFGFVGGSTTVLMISDPAAGGRTESWPASGACSKTACQVTKVLSKRALDGQLRPVPGSDLLDRSRIKVKNFTLTHFAAQELER